MSNRQLSKTPLPRRGRPPKSGVSPEETRARLVQHGIQIFTEKGFSQAGLDEILKHQKVPKGSFYHYFQNKEAFGEVVIQEYAQYFSSKLARHFSNTKLSPVERLQAFVEEACYGMQKYEFRRGCLIGNLGQELNSLPPAFRMQLEEVFQAWQAQLSQLLSEAQQLGELSLESDVDALSAFFWVGWEGAILKAKLMRSTQPMQLFINYYLKLLD